MGKMSMRVKRVAQRAMEGNRQKKHMDVIGFNLKNRSRAVKADDVRKETRK